MQAPRPLLTTATIELPPMIYIPIPALVNSESDYYNDAESDVVTYWTSLAGPAQPLDGPEYSLIPELN